MQANHALQANPAIASRLQSNALVAAVAELGSSFGGSRLFLQQDNETKNAREN